MTLPFLVLVALALLAVLGSLMAGLFAMARWRDQDAALSQRMMRWRVGLQAVAVLCFLIAFMFGRN